MIRTLNFICIAMTGLVCLALYNFSEQARVVKAELRVTETAIKREHTQLAVLGAEWARVTEPNRIHALAKKHLPKLDQPTLRLASLDQLPSKGMMAPQGLILTAKAVIPVPQRKPPRFTATTTVAYMPSSQPSTMAKPRTIAFTLPSGR
jgi:hypothetical protein